MALWFLISLLDKSSTFLHQEGCNFFILFKGHCLFLRDNMQIQIEDQLRLLIHSEWEKKEGMWKDKRLNHSLIQANAGLNRGFIHRIQQFQQGESVNNFELKMHFQASQAKNTKDANIHVITREKLNHYSMKTAYKFSVC